MTTRQATSSNRFSHALIGGFQNIRFGSALTVSVGWAVFLVIAARRIGGLTNVGSDDSVFLSNGDADGAEGLVWFGVGIAVAYIVVSLWLGIRKPDTWLSAFVVTLLFGPMVMMSFALAFSHTFGTVLGDVLSTGSGVLNVAVIATSWLISTNSATEAMTK